MPRIIVIDDDPEMRSILEVILESEGHEVVTAEEGRRGLDCSRVSIPDLVITDLVMPLMDGLETIRKFREEFSGVPIIAISGNCNVANLLDNALRLGAVRTLAKPFLPAALLGLVQEVLSTP